MREIGKTIRKLALMFAAVLVLSSSMTASASGGEARLKSLKILDDRGKTASKITLYTNGEDDAVQAEGAAVSPRSATLTVAAASSAGGQGDFLVTSSNRKIATVTRDGNKIVITAGTESGKAVITAMDKNNLKKTAKVNVTVNTLAESVNFDGAPNVKENSLTVAVKGKLALGAQTDEKATSKKLKYTVYRVNDDGSYTEQSKKDAVVTVDAKGNVTGKKIGTAVIRVTAQDQAALNGKKNAKTGCYKDVEVTVQNPSVSGIAYTGITGQGPVKTVALKSNKTSENHTAQMEVSVSGEGGVTFISSKPSVARVDENGVITACGNGTAKISAIPADGGKLKKAAAVTVKVTTDAESISIPNDDITVLTGKTLKLGATVDKKVSDKKLEYIEVACYDENGNAVPADIKNKNKNNTISVSKSGVVKGLKAGSASFVVQSKNNPEVRRTVHVTVVNPVTTLKATVPAYKKNGLVTGQKSTTLYLNANVDNGGGAEGEVSFNSCEIDPSIEYKASGIKIGKDGDWTDLVTLSSSKPSVATVDENGVITAVGKGKTVITVAANDGSKKKASIKVTVVEKVSEISITDDLYTVNNRAVKIGASAPSRASKTKLGYSFQAAEGFGGTVKISGDKITVKGAGSDDYESAPIGTLTISAKDETSYPKQNAFSRTVDVYVLDQPRTATTEDLMTGIEGMFADSEGYADAALSLKKGDKTEGGRFVLPVQVTERDVKWKSSASGVVAVSKDGVLTAKKEGTATISVSAKKGGASADIRVRVGKSQADYEKTIQDRLNMVVTSEDYTWGGMQPSMDSGRAVTIALTDVTLGRTDALALRDEIANVFHIFADAFIDPNFSDIEMAEGQTGVLWSIRKENGALAVRKNNDVLGREGYLAYGAAARKLTDAMCEDTQTLLDWNGRNFEVTLTSTDSLEGYVDLEYETAYGVKFRADDAAIEALIDERAETNIAKVGTLNDLSVTGVSGISYSPESNTTLVEIGDGGRQIRTAVDALRPAAVEACKNIFAEAQHVTIELTGTVKNVSVDEEREYTRGQGDIDGAVDKLFDRLLAKLDDLGCKNLSDLTDLTVRSKATFAFNGVSYDVEHYMVCRTDITGTDARVDDAILGQLETVNKKGEGIAIVSYNADTNTATVDIQDGSRKIDSLSGMGATDIINIILSKSYATKAEILSVAGGDNKTTFDSLQDISALELKEAVCKGSKAAALGELTGKTAAVTLYFGTETNTYTISFTGTSTISSLNGFGGTSDGTDDGLDVTMPGDGIDVTAPDGDDAE